MEDVSAQNKAHLSLPQLLLSCALLLAATSVLCLIFARRAREDPFAAFSCELYRQEMTANTLNLHYGLAHPELFGITEYPVTLPIYEAHSAEKASAQLSKVLEDFHFLPREGLSLEDQYACDCLGRMLALSKELAAYPHYANPLSPTQGVQGELPILLSEYAFRSKHDVEEYLTLLGQVDDYFSSLLTYEAEKVAAGLSPSAQSLSQSAAQCDAIVTFEELSQGTHFLQTSFEERLEGLQHAGILSTREKEDYLVRNNALLKDTFLPACQKLKDGLSELASLAPDGPCPLASYPRGKDYYRLLLASVTGSGKTPEEVRSLLMRTLTDEVSAIRQLMEKYPGCLSSLKSHSYEDLGIYDASVILSDLRFQMQGVYPGHLYQNAYSSSCILSLKNNLLRQLLGCGGYLEGWAFYVEQNAYDSASKLLIKNNRPADAVCVQIARHERSLRLCLCALADLMIHYDGATPGDLADLCSSLGIQGLENANALCQYVCDSPCNYPKYYLGYLEILELRQAAQRLWGSSFDALSFHEFYLSHGPADFENLRKALETTGNVK
ncbi:MAG: DUF885 domain-containing protein [Acetatifactor sp.]|nr:DUF885 domain-containing protein [Acetatifactor sp.]